MPTSVEQIILTPVPNGVTTNADSQPEVALSVHVAPTLSGGPTGLLKDFPDFVNWPQTLLNQDSGDLAVQFTFSNQGKTASYTANARLDTTALDPELWTALFGDGSTIQYTARDGGEPYDKVPVVSYPSDQIAAFLQTTYTSLASGSPTAYPTTDTLGDTYGGIGFTGTGDDYGRLNGLFRDLSNQRLSSITATGAPAAPPYANDWSSADIELAMAALRFYHMPSSRLGTPAAPGLPLIDFHRALTFINQHGALQRALGLVLQFAVPQRPVQDASATNPYVAAAFSTFTPSSGVTFTPVSPRVAADFTAGVPGTGNFMAHPSTSQIVGGQLTLGDPTSFAIYELDVDGGGLKTAQFADNLKLAQSPQSADPDSASGPAPDAPTAYAPPSLRSSGLTVAAVNRGVQFADRLQRGATLMQGASATPPTVPDLMAEDLVTGYVLDVYDGLGKSWNSTALRDITYTATPTTGSPITLTVTDEPGLNSPPRSQTDPTNPTQQQLNLPANLIRWTGWSNAAGRPGQPLAADGSNTVQSSSGPGPFSQMAITAVPHPGSLPALRYGRQYALRARIVDIANNVLPAADGAVIGDAQKRVSPLSVYGRHEPVGSPDLYTWNQPLPGESLKHMVIRDIDSSPTSIRALAPNRIAENVAELHGSFDTSSNVPDPNAYSTIIAREDARYPFAATGTASGTPLWEPITTTAPVPYLPDPLARGAVLAVTDGHWSGSSFRFDFSPASGQSWPLYQPFALVLSPAATRAVNQDTTNRLLTFQLQPGDTVPAQLSSYLSSSDLRTFGLYQWLLLAGGGSTPAGYDVAAASGLTWGLTPWTQIELIYAVQKPLLVPVFNPLSPTRELTWTYAELFGDITYSPKSTARTELLASWAEPVDNGPGTGVPQGPGSSDTTLSPRQSTVFTIPSSLEQTDSETSRFQGRHEFFDTKYRRVTYVGKATSRFTEHYAGQTTVTVPGTAGTPTSAITLPGKGNLGLEDGSVVVSSGNTIFQENTAFTVDPVGATLTFVAPPTGPTPGSTVHVDFLPAVSVETAPTTLDILSTARPLTPTVEFVVPIYQWEPTVHKGNRTTSGRRPSALRVFLSRPWWTSGIGELLGVTCYRPQSSQFASAAVPNIAAPYVSDWGLDPVFEGGDLPLNHPTPAVFIGRTATGTNLTLGETTAVNVDVAGHPVFYDAVRDLWYADIPVAFGKAYTPMLRLALARYQPQSVPGAELSRVVQADIMQLEPGRAAVVVRKSPHLLASVTLAGYSYKHDGDNSDNGPGVATLVVERRNHEIHDETLGWEPAGDPIEMVSATDGAGLTTWRARDIKIPAGGQHRLWIGQYEVIPKDQRKQSDFIAYFPSQGLRLLYQDIIPL